MKANKNRISLETAKLLKDGGVESEYVFVDEIFRDDGRYYTHLIKRDESVGININKLYPAYTWQEILWENADNFFGKRLCNDRGLSFKEVINLLDGSKTNWKFRDEHEVNILSLLQQKKYKKADLYFREHCILIKEEK